MNRNRIYLYLICTIFNMFIQIFFSTPLNILDIILIQSYLLSIYIITDTSTRKLKSKTQSVPFYFSIFNFLRIIACVIFLIPHILKNNIYSNTYIYNFIIVYFIHLYFDIYMLKKTSK